MFKESAPEGDPPATMLELSPQSDLSAVGGVCGEGAFLVAAVDRLPEPQPLVASAVGEADAPRSRGVDQVRDGETEGE